MTSAADLTAPALAHLGRVVARLCADPGTSDARARQLRWVEGELNRALHLGGFPDRAHEDLAVLLSLDATTRYLNLAAAGELRRRATTDPTSASDASMRIRSDCLDLIARAARLPVEIPERPQEPRLRPVVGSQPRTLWRSYLEAQADRRPTSASRARANAIGGLILDTAARRIELRAMNLSDFNEDHTEITVERHPQARTRAPIVRQTLPLSQATRAAVLHWLPFRADLVAELEGADPGALWVHLLNGGGEIGPDGRPIRRLAGMPLQPRGLSRAYAREIEALNAEMHAEWPGWEPLPTKRRAASPGRCQQIGGTSANPGQNIPQAG